MKLANLRPDRPADFKVGPPGDPYLLRWWLIPRNENFNVYYHRFLHDDDDRALHDHPWPSFSIMISGGVREFSIDGVKDIPPGACTYRDAEFAHRLELVEGAPAETLFITGPRIRDWGFLCPQGWTHWRDFVDPNDPGAPGRGCGETSLGDR